MNNKYPKDSENLSWTSKTTGYITESQNKKPDVEKVDKQINVSFPSFFVDGNFECRNCYRPFATIDSLMRHWLRVHQLIQLDWDSLNDYKKEDYLGSAIRNGDDD